MNSSKLIRAITKDNELVNTMTAGQHRALSLLVTYLIKMEVKCAEDKEWSADAMYSNFFKNALPIMIHTVALPELNLEECFSESADIYDIDRKIRQYLRYIDRRYGTWYEPDGKTTRDIKAA